MKISGLLGGLFAAYLVAGSALAVGFTPGNLVVYRVGDGAAAISNVGAAVFIDEFTPAGTLVQSLALPTSGSTALIASGTASSEGFLTVSPNGSFVALAGYNRDLGGTGNVTTTASATVNRIVGIVNSSTGAIDLTTKLTDAYDGSNIRGVYTTDGTKIWLTGTAGSGLGATGGTRYTTLGSTTTTQLSGDSTNLRTVTSFDGQLYVGAASGTLRINTVGTGLPEVSGQTITNLPGIPTVVPSTTTNTSPYAFFLADLDATVTGPDTLYVADDGATALEKFSLVGGSWTSNGFIGVSADDYRGLTASVSGGTVTLYAARKGGTGGTGGGELVSIVDNTGYNSGAGVFSALTPTLLATAGTNTAFRGIALIPGVGGGPSGVAGDYDNDGAVDADDYTERKNNFGGAITTLDNANPTREAGPVDASDYTYWRDLVPGGGAVASAAAVPEPMTLLLALPLVGLALRRRK